MFREHFAETVERKTLIQAGFRVTKQTLSSCRSLIDVDKVWFQKAPMQPIDKMDCFETHVFTLKRVGKKKEFEAFKKLLDEYCQKRKEQLQQETKKVVRFKLS